MKRLFTLISVVSVLFFTFFSFTVNAQQADYDSLYGEVTTAVAEAVSEEEPSLGEETEDIIPEEPMAPCKSEPVVSLEGKTIMMVGNSMLYYGNCVIYGDAGKADYGYFYQLISANGENATVLDHTYSGATLKEIYRDHLKDMSQKDRDKVDIVVLAEANKENKDLLGTCNKIKALFPETTEFFFMCNPMMYYNNIESLLTGTEKLRESGMPMVDWGRLVYDVYSGKTKAPGALHKYDFCSFIIDNTDYKSGNGLTVSGKKPDIKHPNPLSGYISAQMLYTAITNRSALYTDYSFCNDSSIHSRFNIDAFALNYYTGTKKTNFTSIFRSPSDMFGLQSLIDTYLAAEGKHPVHELKAVPATCISGGLSAGYYCPICDEVVKEQEYISGKGGHKIIYKEAVAPTCTKAGRTGSAYCYVCGEYLIKEAVLKATGHSDTVVISQGGIGKSGIKTVTCTVCKAKTAETKIPAIQSVTLSTTEYVYDGKAKKPKVTVKTTDGKVLQADKDYKVTYPEGRKEIGDYKVKVVFQNKYIGSKTLTFKIRAGVTSSLTAKSYLTSVKLTWKKVDNATGYRVYLYNSKTKKYEKYEDTKKTALSVKKLKSGTKYKFRVKAYTVVSGKTYITGSYKYLATVTKPAAVTIDSVASLKRGAVDLKWNKVSGANGYQIAYADNSKFKSVKKSNISSGNKKSSAVTGLKSGKRYYFKVRAYKSISGKKVYGPYSAVKNAIVRW